MYVCVRVGNDIQWQVQSVTAATVSAAAEEIQSSILPQYTLIHTALHLDMKTHSVFVCVWVCVCVAGCMSVKCDMFPWNKFPI